MSVATAPRIYEGEPTPSTMTGRPRKFGRYTLLQKIGHGGMATLYLARLDGPQGFEKFLAVKKIHPHLAEEHQFVRMFLDEARLAAQIHHPNVVQIFELGEVGGEYFFAMEYLEGETLNAIAKRAARTGGSPRQLVAHVVARAAEGLHAAHELRGPDGSLLGLVHRDVSPQNVLVTYDGIVKVVDFGIAKAANRLAHTETGQLKGKYAYMAPEQIVAKDVDRRADIFALGVVLYEATTLRRLFKGENELQTLDNVLRHAVPPPTSLDPSYAPELEQIVLRALAKDPAHRFQTCSDLAVQLDRYALSQRRPANTAAVAAWMRQHFPQESETKKRMLLVGRTLPVGAPSLEEEAGEKRGGGGRLAIVLAAVVVGVLALAGTLAVLFISRSGEGAADSGAVTVATAPVSAEVYIDGAGPLGSTPLAVEQLKIGRHSIKVVAEGYAEREDEFVIEKAGHFASVMLHLESLAPESGLLEISGPTGAKVKVDGELRDGRAPMRVDLSPGKHDVTLLAEGFHPFDQQVTVKAGQTILMPAPTLKRIAAAPVKAPPEHPPPTDVRVKPPPPRGYGYLTLASSPWAYAYRGGRKLGQTPLNRIKLPAGRHSIKLVPEGRGPPKTISIVIQPNEEVRRRVNL